jgi:MtN3 and saliva related transmembrane protein
MIELLGFVAGALTAFAFLPQVVKTWRTRSSSDLSMAMLGAQSAGVSLWILYGVGINSIPVILSNTITLTMCVVLLVLKLTTSAAS